jgi:hypothetical protein
MFKYITYKHETRLAPILLRPRILVSKQLKTPTFGKAQLKKGSCNRPGVAQRVPGGSGSQIFMTFGTYRW